MKNKSKILLSYVGANFQNHNNTPQKIVTIMDITILPSDLSLQENENKINFTALFRLIPKRGGEYNNKL